MSATQEAIRAFQVGKVRRLLLTRLGFSIRVGRVPQAPEDDPFGLPTAYGERERNYYNDLLDDAEITNHA